MAPRTYFAVVAPSGKTFALRATESVSEVRYQSFDARGVSDLAIKGEAQRLYEQWLLNQAKFFACLSKGLFAGDEAQALEHAIGFLRRDCPLRVRIRRNGRDS